MSLASLRADYVAGRIEVEDFEAGLDALVAQDPEVLDRREVTFGISDEPGAIIPYNPIHGTPTWSSPPSTANVHAVLREVYAPRIAFSDSDEGDNGGLPFS